MIDIIAYKEDSSNSDSDFFQNLESVYNNNYESIYNNIFEESSSEFNNILEEYFSQKIINESQSKNSVSNKNENTKDLEVNRNAIIHKKKKIIFQIEQQSDNIFHIKKSDENSNENKNEFSKVNQKNDKINKKRKRISLYERDNKHPFRIKRKKSKRRRNDADKIRNKIISKFFNILMKNINQNLKSIGSSVKFMKFPRIFTRYISRILKEKIKKEEKNKIINIKEIDLPFQEIIQKKFCDIKKSADIKNYEGNKKALKYLEENKEIYEKSKFNIIGKKSFSQLFKEYVNSKEYENELFNLKVNKKNEGTEENEEKEKYIEKYKNKTQKILNYFYQ